MGSQASEFPSCSPLEPRSSFSSRRSVNIVETLEKSVGD